MEAGIANFDDYISCYIKAGGDALSDSEKQTDLLAIFPDALRKDFV